MNHRFPVCHIAQQNTSITYACVAFTEAGSHRFISMRRIAARLELLYAWFVNSPFAPNFCSNGAELLLHSSRSYSRITSAPFEQNIFLVCHQLRVVHGSGRPAGRVGSGRVGSNSGQRRNFKKPIPLSHGILITPIINSYPTHLRMIG